MQISFNPLDQSEREIVREVLDVIEGDDQQAPSAAEAFGNTIPPALSIEAVASVTNSLDSAGMPWDARIHASSKTKVANGTWRTKRGVHPDTIKQVEGELKQLMSAPAVTVTAPMPPAPVAVAPAPAPVAVAPAPAPVAVAPAPAPVAVAPAPAADPLAIPAFLQRNPAPTAEVVAEDPRKQFVKLVGDAAKAMQAGKITEDEVKQICAQFGVAALPLLANRLDLVPAVAVSIEQLLASRG